MKLKITIGILLLIMLLVLGLMGCVHLGQNVLYEIEDIKINELDAKISDWVKHYIENEGIYLARIPISNKVEEYYVYINRQDVYSIEIGNSGEDNNTLKIVINRPDSVLPIPTSGDNPFAKQVTKLTTINKRADYIMLNDERIEVSSIEIIE